MVSAERGDGLLLNRTARYPDTVTLALRVVDAAGHPADSARVMVATENYYDPNALSLTTGRRSSGIPGPRCSRWGRSHSGGSTRNWRS